MRIAIWINRMVRRFGWVILPMREIEIMEQDSREYYPVMYRDGISERNRGYFNGCADYAGKKATQLRERYVPQGRP